jgi:hypothetical protein
LPVSERKASLADISLEPSLETLERGSLEKCETEKMLRTSKTLEVSVAIKAEASIGITRIAELIS